ncbi:hypothetical protein [Primorskyibacter sp. 2E233]|uniref:hypothetical protein n=1 Tax=Primorskyibacter sp. 2E233 TaxID=3413431 RepID=UPI003BF18CD8
MTVAPPFCERWDQASFDRDNASKPLEYWEPLARRVFARKAYDPDVFREGAVSGLP